jgi:hypothetical protein
MDLTARKHIIGGMNYMNSASKTLKQQSPIFKNQHVIWGLLLKISTALVFVI